MALGLKAIPCAFVLDCTLKNGRGAMKKEKYRSARLSAGKGYCTFYYYMEKSYVAGAICPAFVAFMKRQIILLFLFI